ncbi:MAG: SipW-dependent-type signal peptide-containing protein [Acutalibacteraceae bacterium]|nr:SipW-dependent-type signal peptide-containing protein [Acutalibacteraceae bacterium]
MNNTKTTKRALLSSVMAMFICVAMLIGTTFAWFTDSASTAVNKIQAGTLQIELQYATAWDTNGNPTAWADAEGKTLNFRTADGRTDNILWEPGCTYELPAIRIVNKGNLALKYELAITGIKGDAKLNDAIEWKNGSTDALLSEYTDTMIPGQHNNVTDPIVIKGHMKEDAGNEYQGLSIDGIGITVVATQFNSEYDSTDNEYDTDATYLNKDASGHYLISNANELVYFAKSVNVDNKTYAGETVKLTADINLAGKKWIPVGPNADTSNKFKGTFDGNYKTISNLTVDTATNVKYQATGFFGALNGTAKNFTIDGATVTGMSAPSSEGRTNNGIAVVAGSIYTTGSIEGVTVKNATVSGNRYVGGISGYTYGSVKNCKVEDVQLTATPDNLTGSYDNGDKVGGIVGAFWHENTYEISGNTVKNVTITGYRDMGGIAGFANGSVKNNTVDGLTLIQDYSILTDPKTTVEGIIGRPDGFAPDATNTATNVTIKLLANASTAEELSQIVAGAQNSSITLSTGTYTLPTVANKTVSISGTKDTVIDLSIGTQIGQTGGANLTFDGVTIKGETGQNYSGIQHAESVEFVNCTFEGKLTLYSESTFINCTFNNDSDYAIWTWGAGTAKFVGCTFNSGGKALLLYDGSASAGNRITNLIVTDCVFNDNDKLSTTKAAIEIGDNLGQSTDPAVRYNLTVKNVTVNGFAENNEGTSTNSTIWGNKNSMPNDRLNVIIDGVDVY